MINELFPGAGGKSLLVCSTGGHLAELLRLEARFGAHPDSLWVTFDTPQSRQMLEGRRVFVLPYIGPRDLSKTLAAAPSLDRVLRGERFDAAVSTGAAIATAALPLAMTHRIPSTYIESVCRVRGPSTTGRILQRLPGVNLRTQNTQWADDKWLPLPSVLADFRSEPLRPSAGVRRVYVTLGTIRGYRFDSVIDAFLATGLASDETVWQLGDTRRTGLPGIVHDYLSPAQSAREAASADVVISHAGVGTLLELLSLGIFSIQAVRRAARKEHVDDHQLEFAEAINTSGIGLAVEGPQLTRAMIEHAAGHRVVDAAASVPITSAA